MNILKLLNADGYICCSKVVIKAFGVFEALVLGKLCSVAQRFGYDEFYISMDKICEDIGLSEYQVRGAINNLKEKGILSITKKGLPCRCYYTFHEDRIIEIIGDHETRTSTKKTQEQEQEKLECRKESGFGAFKVIEKDKKKDMEKENNNMVPPPHEPSAQSVDDGHNPEHLDSPYDFSASNTVNEECLKDVQECHKTVFERWVGAGLPLSRASAQSYFTFSCRELKLALGHWQGKNLAPEEILEALGNYITLAGLIRSGKSWMDNVGGLDYFAKHTLDFLDGNFQLDRYQKRTMQDGKAFNKDEVAAMMAEMGIVENH